jgi:hypothetical protein
MKHVNNLWDKMARCLLLQRVVRVTATGLCTVNSEMSVLLKLKLRGASCLRFEIECQDYGILGWNAVYFGI